MSAVLVIVTNILREQSLQMAFVHGDDVIQQVTNRGADPNGNASRKLLDGPEACRMSEQQVAAEVRGFPK